LVFSSGNLNLDSSVVTSLGTPSGSNANGGSIASNVLTLSLADATNPGLVSTGAQTFAGNKTYTGNILVHTPGAAYTDIRKSQIIFGNSASGASTALNFNASSSNTVYLPGQNNGTLALSVNGFTANSSGAITVSGLVTASNGLTINTPDNVELGGSLTQNTLIETNTFNFGIGNGNMLNGNREFAFGDNNSTDGTVNYQLGDLNTILGSTNVWQLGSSNTSNSSTNVLT
jgi:hypothetical protein